MLKRFFGIGLLLFIFVFILSCGGGGGGSSDGATHDSQVVAATAITNLGTDSGAGTAVLMALANGRILSEIVDSIEGDTLTATGTIESTASALSLHAAATEGLGDICDYPEDKLACSADVNYKLDNLILSELLNENVTGVILRAANRGYSAEQIMNTLMDMLLSNSNVHINEYTGEIFIITDQSASEFEDRFDVVEPENKPVDLFSDQDLTQTDSDDDDDSTGDDGDTGDTGNADPYPWNYRGTFNTYSTMVSGEASASIEGSGYYEVTLLADGTIEGTSTILPGPNFLVKCGPEIKIYQEDGNVAPLNGTHDKGEIAIGAYNWEPIDFGVYDSAQITLIDRESVATRPAPDNCTEEKPGYPSTKTTFVEFEPLTRTNPPK